MKNKFLVWFYKTFQIYDMMFPQYGITCWYTNKIDWGIFFTVGKKRIVFCSEHNRRY